LQAILKSPSPMKPDTEPLTDAEEARHITIRKGKLFLVDRENIILLTSPIIIKNKVVVSVDGLINMPDGTKRTLLEGEYLYTS
jgi:hypothetical protein